MNEEEREDAKVLLRKLVIDIELSQNDLVEARIKTLQVEGELNAHLKTINRIIDLV